MIIIKNDKELDMMREAGKISAEALEYAGSLVKPGISTWEIDKKIENFILSKNAKPSFKNLYGFPGSACISVNDVLIHGIPDKNIILKEGDIISIDLGANYRGYNGDNTKTFPVGEVSADIVKLLKVTEESLLKGIDKAVAGNRVSDISGAVQDWCEKNGYSIVKEYTGHGVGKKLHEDPSIPNYRGHIRGPRLMCGMTIAIEPMVNMGSPKVVADPDGWNVRSADGLPNAHFEHTVAITENGPEILTLP
ncbi:MAG: type I methionyl aminopeptidase [Clostridia bacterium]|nr:type I methionyl aminopeptidase [Clostridia bacterium]